MQPQIPQNLTFVFTDLTDSTRLWDAHSHVMPRTLAQLEEIVKNLGGHNNGRLFKTVGDEFCLAFSSADEALEFARTIHQTIKITAWPPETPVQLKTAVHTGSAQPSGEDYLGPALNETARLLSIALSDQILVSEQTRSLLSSNVGLHYLGQKRAKGLSQPLTVYEISANPDGPKPIFQQPLPRNLTPVFGRQAELAEIHNRLQSHCALISLTGVGGVGKSTLARAVIEHGLSNKPTIFVECTSLLTEDDFLTSLLVALHSDAVKTAKLDEVVQILSDHPSLLVLDCFEGLVQHRLIVSQLVQRCPGLQILVTSRILLGLSEEHEIPLQPLNATSPNASAELFRDVAARKGVQLPFDSATDLIIAKVCNLLDHLPLALVLAASRLRYLTLHDLVERLQTWRIKTLADQNSTEKRHASLLQTVRDSISLLKPDSAKVLLGLSHFRGGFLIQDAATVLELNTDDLSDHVDDLRDHSLVQRMETGKRTRYVILDSIREAVLDTPDSKILDRHAGHYASLARQWFDRRYQAESHADQQRIIADLANIRQALDHTLSTEDRGLRLDILSGLLPALLETGLFQDFVETSQSALALAKELEKPEIELSVLGHQGAFWFFQGMPEKGVQTWISRLDLSRKHGLYQVALDTILDLAEHEFDSNRFSEAKRWLAQAELILDEPECAPLRSTYYAIVLTRSVPRQTKIRKHQLATQLEQNLISAVAPSHRAYAIRALAQHLTDEKNYARAEAMWKSLLSEGAELGHVTQVCYGAIGLINCRLATVQPSDDALALILCLQSRANHRMSNKIDQIIQKIQDQSPNSLEHARRLSVLPPENLVVSIVPCNPVFASL